MGVGGAAWVAAGGALVLALVGGGMVTWGLGGA